MTLPDVSPIRFSIFDHLDESGRDQGQTYRERLSMLEVAEAAGYFCYHLAEHHGTELSMTPSPGLFLAAASQRTSTLRLGPLTYLLPLYNPLRLLEEICMLDQLSGGRLELGVSRGSSPYEGLRFGVQRDDARPMFNEALDIILMGLAQGELNYNGRYWQYDHVLTRQRCVQKPYPPLWYPTSNVDSIPWLAGQGFNTIFSLPLAPTTERVIEMLQMYEQEYARHAGDANRLNGHVSMPNYGIAGLTVVAATDEIAQERARPAYKKYNDNYVQRYVRVGEGARFEGRGDFDRALRDGTVIVGSPETVRRQLAPYFTRTSANYFLGEFAFGDLPAEAVQESLKLFASEVMPALREERTALASG